MLPKETRDRIIRMRQSGCDWASIGLACEKSPDACRVWYAQWRKTAHLPPKVKVSKRVIQGRTAQQLKQIVINDPTISARNLEPALQAAMGPDVKVPSWRTCYNYLNENKFRIATSLNKPLISATNREKRVAFAKKYLEMDPDYYEHVIWTDETTVRALPQGKKLQFWVHSSVENENYMINPQVQAGGFSVMFWGAFSRAALGPLVVIDGTMNGDKYIELLKKHFLPELQAAGKPMALKQDNSPCHKKKSVMEFLAANNVHTLDWPPQSPDLNPIENLWAIIKRKRQKLFGVPRSKRELIEQILTIWDSLDVKLLESLVDSFERRLEAVIKLGGRPTKY
jgi:transposase